MSISSKEIFRELDGLSGRDEGTRRTRASAESSHVGYTVFLVDSGVLFYEPTDLDADSVIPRGEVPRASFSNSVLRDIIYSMTPEV